MCLNYFQFKFQPNPSRYLTTTAKIVDGRQANFRQQHWRQALSKFDCLKTKVNILRDQQNFYCSCSRGWINPTQNWSKICQEVQQRQPKLSKAAEPIFAYNINVKLWSTLNVKVTAFTTFEIADIFIKAAHEWNLPPVEISAKSVKNYDNSSQWHWRPSSQILPII